ncbi:MAG TPA: FG-GAP-like repeat-containing protein, partial [Ramlibacter sp.]|nr:FG-GAP-like repeat-containing protein [Ramlibacter sp.]
VLISNPDGTYTDRSSALPQAPDYTHSACAGDIDGDGHQDIYVGNIYGADRVGPYVLKGVGDGTFTKWQSGLPASLVGLNEMYLSCHVVDADHDGHADLVLGAYNPTNSAGSVILFNDGTGDFTKRPRYTLPPHAFGAGDFLILNIMALDANRDGRTDLLLLATRSNYSGTGMQLLVNAGNGTFVDETTARLGSSANVATGSYCGAIRRADLNGDGWDDFYCRNGPADVANRYWLSNADGTWSAAPADALPQGRGVGVHAVDFDGDGRPDLLDASHSPEADVSYKSFLNRTARIVPSEPLVTAAVASNSQATIHFAPPLAAGASPVTGYTATCTRGPLASVVTATGVASPLVVSGLVNGQNYSCTVTAQSWRGIGSASATVAVRPQP